jgi:CotH kinase protein
MATDPTQAREWLSWDLIRRLGMVGPKAELLRLYVNGAYIGLYMDIEWMDEAMFSRLGFAQGGHFFQPNDSAFCGDLSPASTQNSTECWSRLFPRDADLAPLIGLIKELDAVTVERFDEFLDQRFDAQSVVDWLLVNTLTQNGDTYNKNYFLHQDAKDGRWRVIPWDYDLTWGRVADGALPFPRMIYNAHFHAMYPPDLGAPNPLKDKALANPKIYARFIERMREVLGEPGTLAKKPAAAWYRPDEFQRRLAAHGQLVRPSLQQEKYPSSDFAAYDQEVQALVAFNEWRYHFLRNLLLVPNPFDRARWLPNTAYPPLTPVTEESQRARVRQTVSLAATTTFTALGERRFLIEDLLGWPLAAAQLNKGALPARLTVETEREQAPFLLPPKAREGDCIERSWVVMAKTTKPVELNLEFDYLEESSLRHELGKGIKKEQDLSLWSFDGARWSQHPTEVNQRANRLRVRDIALQPHIGQRFVACVSPGKP